MTKTGSKDVLRWPAFQTEQLARTYWSAGENMGRIKVTIAEGYAKDGEHSRFVRTRNVVTFSFQHAPLSTYQNPGERSIGLIRYRYPRKQQHCMAEQRHVAANVAKYDGANVTLQVRAYAYRL